MDTGIRRCGSVENSDLLPIQVTSCSHPGHTNTILKCFCHWKCQSPSIHAKPVSTTLLGLISTARATSGAVARRQSMLMSFAVCQRTSWTTRNLFMHSVLGKHLVRCEIAVSRKRPPLCHRLPVSISYATSKVLRFWVLQVFLTERIELLRWNA